MYDQECFFIEKVQKVFFQGVTRAAQKGNFFDGTTTKGANECGANLSNGTHLKPKSSKWGSMGCPN
jgi:hypothetical protein